MTTDGKLVCSECGSEACAAGDLMCEGARSASFKRVPSPHHSDGERVERVWPQQMRFSTECPNCGNLDSGHERGCSDPTLCVEYVDVIPAGAPNVLSPEEARLLVKANEQPSPDNPQEMATFVQLLDRLADYGKEHHAEH